MTPVLFAVRIYINVHLCIKTIFSNFFLLRLSLCVLVVLNETHFTRKFLSYMKHRKE